MKLSQTQKLILAILLFALTGFVLYSTFKSDSSAPQAAYLNSTTATGNVGFAQDSVSVEFNENQDIVDLAKEFESISYNIDIFNSPLFLNLKDIDTTLYPESFGRPNPFSPIGVDSFSRTVQNTVSASTTIVKNISES